MPIRFPALHRWRQALALLLCSLLSIAPVAADPVGRVGRIAWLSGSVHLHRAGSGESSTAVINWPLSSGDILSTAAGARAELQVGSTVFQLASGSVLEFVQLDDQRVQLHLLDGSVIARIASRGAAREFELGTRDGRFQVRDAGRYRFDSDRSTSAGTVYAGNLHFAAADLAFDLGAGQRVQLWDAGGTQHQFSAPANDEFALWSAARERQYDLAGQARHVSPEMTGAVDLDAHGSWYESPEYGSVWFPRAVAADWAPYRSGRWAWVEPWGWTWVGQEAWGFAPFHYGRWAFYRGAWAWVPGKWVARPVYAPALVAWVGTSRAALPVQVGAQPAVVGWFPLAPREVYIPPYRSSASYVRQVNHSHITNITNLTEISNNPQAAAERTRYAHQRLPQALTVVPADVMTQRRGVAEAALPHRDRALWATQPALARAPLGAPYTEATRRPDGELRTEQGRHHRDASGSPANPAVGGSNELQQMRPAAGSGTPASANSTVTQRQLQARVPGAENVFPPSLAMPVRPVGPTNGASAAPLSRETGHQAAGQQIPAVQPGSNRRPDVLAPLNAPGSPMAPPASAPVSFGEKSDRSGTSPVPFARERRETAADARAGTIAPPVVGPQKLTQPQPLPALRSSPEVRADGSEPAAGGVLRPSPSPRPDRHESPAMSTPVPAETPLAAPPRFERPPSAMVVRPPVAQGHERAEQRFQTPVPPPQVVALPRPAARPASASLPMAMPIPPGAPAPEERRREERAANREDMARQQWRQGPRVLSPPPAMPQQAPSAPVRLDQPARPDRSLGPERAQESGRPAERRADPRDGRRPHLHDQP